MIVVFRDLGTVDVLGVLELRDIRSVGVRGHCDDPNNLLLDVDCWLMEVVGVFHFVRFSLFVFFATRFIGVAPCCGGSLSSSSMISLHKIKSSRDLEVRTYVHRLAGRSQHTTPPGTDTLSHHNFKCGRVKASWQWRYLRGSTADSCEERSVSSLRPWLSSKQCSLRP